MAFQPADPNGEVNRRRHHLPHWDQAKTTMFVAFRFGDSVPQQKLQHWNEERVHWLTYHGVTRAADIANLPEELRQEYHHRFTVRFHEWLDAGYGECLLRLPQVGQIVANALRHFHGTRYAIESFVIMPNHVHALFTPVVGMKSSDILHTWKSYTVHAINSKLERKGELWQKESYNRLVRDEVEFHHYRHYIWTNPTRAKLQDRDFIWWDALGVPSS